MDVITGKKIGRHFLEISRAYEHVDVTHARHVTCNYAENVAFLLQIPIASVNPRQIGAYRRNKLAYQRNSACDVNDLLASHKLKLERRK